MLTRTAPPDDAVARFVADFLAIDGAGVDRRIGLCVSGGPDSVAMLLLAHSAFPGIEAATVDHGLRAASADEAAFVARLCGELGVPHATLELTELGGGNVSAAAREARYAALRNWAEARNLDCLMTAHHADDQLETMVMRLNRGSGVAGLSGIRGHNDGLYRPLLGWRRAELGKIVRDCGVAAVDDPSNRDDRFDRARLRKALAGADWLDPVAASRSAAALVEAEDALNWSVQQQAFDRVRESEGSVAFDPSGLPRELARRIFLDCVRRVDRAATPRAAAVARAIDALWNNQTVTLGSVKCSSNGVWTFEAAPPRRAGG